MNDLIERYIYDVTRRLPEKERGEIKLELEASIADMLPDDPGKQEIIDVLTDLGAPGLLAERYRQKPRYLISPALFDTYISVLKTVAIIVAVVSGCLGAVLAISSGSISEIITRGVSMAYEAALQTALWITIGFAIADRNGYRQKWSPDDLPPLPTGVRISRSSSIVGMIMSVFLPALFIALIIRGESFFIYVRGADIITPFSQAAMERFIPYLIILGVMGLAVNAFKLYWARWNVPLCLMTVLQNIVWVGAVICALNWPDLLSSDFLGFMNSINVGADILRSAGKVFSVVIIIAAAAEIVTGIRNTWKSVREPTR